MMRLCLSILATALLFAEQGNGLSCYTCTSELNEDCATKGIGLEVCDPKYDVCYKVVTVLEQPNNGPQDRLKDNASKMSVTRGCGQKRAYNYGHVDKSCADDTTGGGGYQERCMCAGNECNASNRIKAAIAVLAVPLLAALL